MAGWMVRMDGIVVSGQLNKLNRFLFSLTSYFFLNFYSIFTTFLFDFFIFTPNTRYEKLCSFIFRKINIKSLTNAKKRQQLINYFQNILFISRRRERELVRKRILKNH